MMYHFQTLKDVTEITRSHIIEKDGVNTVEVHFERPGEGGFGSAQCILPTFQWRFQDGLSDEDVAAFDEFLRENIDLLFECALTKATKWL